MSPRIKIKIASRRARIFGALLAVACVTWPELGVSGQDAATNIDIGANKAGAAPTAFDLSQGQWTVVGDATATGGLAIEQSGVQTTDDRYPLAISKTVSLKNAEISLPVSLDGPWVSTGFDKTFSQPGRVALWTEGDSNARFDSIAIASLPASEERY